MAWTKGKRRGGLDGCADLLSRIGPIREIARAAGVSPRAVSWWLTGPSAPSLEVLQRIIDHFLPSGSGRISETVSGGISETTLESNTPIGVGEYSRRAAAGKTVPDDFEPDLSPGEESTRFPIEGEPLQRG